MKEEVLPLTPPEGIIQTWCWKNVVIFGVDNKHALNQENRKSDFLVLGKGSAKFGVDEVKAEHELNVNMSHPDGRFVLSCIM